MQTFGLRFLEDDGRLERTGRKCVPEKSLAEAVFDEHGLPSLTAFRSSMPFGDLILLVIVKVPDFSVWLVAFAINVLKAVISELAPLFP
ncbi:hypothetical protein [Neorhizobium sp. BT27B]|uniref:hypothetical protein n=1 Tax=Neorhizobium sp. BT27B TaxID=3142625 RepID=UPI003D2B7E3F